MQTLVELQSQREEIETRLRQLAEAEKAAQKALEQSELYQQAQAQKQAVQAARKAQKDRFESEAVAMLRAEFKSIDEGISQWKSDFDAWYKTGLALQLTQRRLVDGTSVVSRKYLTIALETDWTGTFASEQNLKEFLARHAEDIFGDSPQQLAVTVDFNFVQRVHAPQGRIMISINQALSHDNMRV